MKTERDLQLLVSEWQTRLEELGYTLGRYEGLRVSSRMTRTLGCCYKRMHREYDGYYTTISYSLVFSKALLAMSDEDIENTVAHEICHAVDGSYKHDKIWRGAADACEKWYGIKISIYCEGEELKRWMDAKKEILSKYMVVCRECGKQQFFTKNNLLVTSLIKRGGSCGNYCPECRDISTYDLYIRDKKNGWKPFECVELVPF